MRKPRSPVIWGDIICAACIFAMLFGLLTMLLFGLLTMLAAY